MHRTNSEKTRAQYQTDYALFHRYQREEIEHLSLTGSLYAGDPEWFRLQPQIDIASQYFVSICYAFAELVECYGWAVAAERVARQLETQAKKDYAGYWRYTVRNYHLRNFLAGYFALQDHVAFMINELSKYELVPADKDGHPRRVDFPKVKSALESRRQGAKGTTYLSKADVEAATEALSRFTTELTEQQLSFLRRCRNVGAHRYLIGIDHMTVSIQNADILSRAVPDRGVAWHLEIEDEGPHRYTYFGEPELRYDDLQPLYKTLLESATCALEKLLLIDAVKRAFDSHDKDVT